ncbi:hypothetical protein E2I00_003165, partial [Balaenoptera physalus]
GARSRFRVRGGGRCRGAERGVNRKSAAGSARRAGGGTFGRPTELQQTYESSLLTLCSSSWPKESILDGVLWGDRVMWRKTMLGFTLGNVVGMYLAQNYDIPNLAKKLEEIKKDVDAKKKPPSS